jgi:NaMN:DMB phosphoribosyltransferase
MMPANVGMILGAAKHIPVIVGGGTQMAAVIAAAVRLDGGIVGNVLQGTTRWLMEDPHSNMEKMMESISPDVPIVYVNMDYSASPYEGLQAYEWGYIKEGVGCGGSSIAAIVQSSGKITCDDLLGKVHEIYRKIMSLD